MSTTTSANPGWAPTMFAPRPRSAATPIVIAGIPSSKIVDAALADPAVSGAIRPEFVPTCPPPATNLLWRIETASGEPLTTAGLLRRHWHRQPFALTLRLVEYKPGSLDPEILDEATLGTTGPWPLFRTSVDRLAMRFVRDAALGCARGPATSAPAEAPSGGPGWVQYRRSRWLNRMSTEWWSLGTLAISADQLLSGHKTSDISWFNPRPGTRYLADPFPWPGTDRILCEDMPVSDGVGRIIAVTPRDGHLQQTEIVLEDGAHHSYPCTFQHESGTLCIPESVGRGQTRIYRLSLDGALTAIASPAPDRRLADSTLFHHGGRYWLACTDLDIGGHDNLCLLHAPEVEGPWEPHERWPVKIDIRGARPAGLVFEHEGRLLRPAQNCAATYGAAVVIHEIQTLTTSDFVERPVLVLRPDPNGPFPDGLHTLVHDGVRFWVDGKRFVFSPNVIARKFINKAARLLGADARMG